MSLAPKAKRNPMHTLYRYVQILHLRLNRNEEIWQVDVSDIWERDSA